MKSGPPLPPKIPLPTNEEVNSKKRKWPTVQSDSTSKAPPPPPTNYASSYSEKRFEKRTTFSGLSNQGATCYLNSLLQALYHTPEFRNLIYSWKYDPETHGKETDCIPFQFQKLFAFMDKGVRGDNKTKDLTISFGWESSASFQQHDVQELMRVLFDALDSTLRTESNKDPVSDLYKGILIDYIKVIDPERNVTKQQEAVFLDLQLVIRNAKSVEEAIENFLTPEVMDGDNKWRCEELGNILVDAKKGFFFKSLPSILTLQLKRFDYDPVTWNRVKLSNCVTFPFTLDMSPFLEGGEKYDLFAVLIHSGGAESGHYYAYIKSYETNKWYNCNDATVSEITIEKVEEMFGGKEDKKTYGSRTYSVSTNAYMLIYRKCSAPTLLPDFSILPKEIQELVNKDNEGFEKEKEEYIKTKNQITARVYSNELEEPIVIKLEKNWKLKDSLDVIHKEFVTKGLVKDLENVRLFHYNILEKRPSRSFVAKEEKTLDELGFFSYNSLFLQTKGSEEIWPETHDYIQIAVFPVDPVTNEIVTPILCKIEVDSTLKSAKSQISTHIGTLYQNVENWMDQLVLVRYNISENTPLEGDDKLFETDLLCRDNSILYCGMDKEKILEAIENLKYLYNIYFNEPGSEEMSKTIQIDSRKSLGELKEQIGKVLNLKADEFIISKKLARSPYREMTKLIKEVDLTDNSQLVVEKGVQLGDHDACVKLYLYVPQEPEPISETKSDSTSIPIGKIDINSEETKSKFLKMKQQFTFMGSVAVNEDMKLLEWKTFIANKFALDDPNRVRLRIKNGLVLKKPLIDSGLALKDLIPQFSSGPDIAITLLDSPEFLVEGDILIRVMRWYPSKWAFDPKRDILINKLTCKSVDSLKNVLSKEYEIAFENIRIAKPPMAFDYWQVQECAEIPLLNWDVETQNITAPPLSLEDGSIILCKDTTESEKIPLEDLIKMGVSAEKKEIVREVALKIKTHHK